MRYRDKLWLDEIVNHAGPEGFDDEAKLAAAVASDRNIAFTKDPDRALTLARRKFNTLINRPDVREAIRHVYEELAEFSPEEALRLHIKHIRGDITRDRAIKVRDISGNEEVEVHQERLPPSWPALKAYLDATIPAPPKEVRSKHEHLHASLGRVTLGEGVETAPRQIGPELPEERDAFEVDEAGTDAVDSDDEDLDDEDEEDE